MIKRIGKLFRPYSVPLAIAAPTFLIVNSKLNDTLDLDRAKIASGDWWLLFSGHFCHLNWQHWLLNIVALFIIWDLFFHKYSIVRACGEIMVLALCVGLGVYWFNPDTEWYVGLSGVLHGLFAIGISKEIFEKNKLSVVIAVIFTGKIVWEQTVGATTRWFFDEGTVLVDAHLYGSIAGAIIALAYQLRLLVLKKR